MGKVIIASGPVIIEGGKVLLVKHGDTPFWKFCGGTHEEKDRSLIETAKSEAREEIGAEIEISDPEPFLFYTRKKTGEDEQEIILVYFCASLLGEIKPGKDIKKWAWHPLDDLPVDLAPNVIPTLVYYELVPKSDFDTNGF